MHMHMNRVMCEGMCTAGFDLTLGFYPDWKNRDHGCKFAPKSAAESSFASLPAHLAT